MMISDELKDKLKVHNPFLEWKNLDRKLKFSEERALIEYSRFSIPYHNMSYGDSIFVPMPRKFWKKIKYEFIHNKNIRVKFLKRDNKYNWGGMRVWNFNRIVPIRRPRMSFIVTGQAA